MVCIKAYQSKFVSGKKRAAACTGVSSLYRELVSGFSFGVLQMGACFSKVFDGCPLKINCATSWIHPDTKGKVL